MNKKGIVQIHGKEYMTVARRVELAHEEKAFKRLTTEVLSHSPVVIKATVTINDSEFTGISSVNTDSARMIEKSNPYEVAETSAVGRALGFAGYGIVEGIASADEMYKAPQVRVEDGMTYEKEEDPYVSGESEQPEPLVKSELFCEVCGEEAKEKAGISKAGNRFHGIFCSSGERTHTKWLSTK